MHYARFLVNERPVCVWNTDLHERSLEFLQSVDPKYFHYIATSHVESLGRGDAHRAAVALRTAYGHALEVLFSHMFAALQAPDCVFGWLSAYERKDVEGLISAISEGKKVAVKFPLEEFSWNAISKCIHQGLSISDPTRTAAVTDAYASLWSRLASDFMDEDARLEYNSLRHGLRVAPGGVTLRVSPETTRGAPSPPEKVSIVGGDKYGSTYFLLRKIGGQKYNFQSRRVHVNWSPGNFANALSLIGMSLNNIVTFLLAGYGIATDTLKYRLPDELDHFDWPWRQVVSLTKVDLDEEIHVQHIVPLSARKIRDVYRDKDPNPR